MASTVFYLPRELFVRVVEKGSHRLVTTGCKVFRVYEHAALMSFPEAKYVTDAPLTARICGVCEAFGGNLLIFGRRVFVLLHKVLDFSRKLRYNLLPV
jgi:hypothetical protein